MAYHIDSGVPFLADDDTGKIIGYVDNKGQETSFGNLSVTATNGSTDISLANRFGMQLNLKDFGAVGDGVTDDSAAWQAACTAVNTFISGASWPSFPRSRSQLYVPPGRYVINTGAALTDCNFEIVGDKNTVSFSVGAGQYLLTVTNAVYEFCCINAARFYNGAGFLKATYGGTVVWNGLNISDNDFINYTECAIGILSSDFPYKTIERNFFYGHSSLTSKGIVFAGDSTRSSIRNNRFLSNRYHIKCVESNMLISDNDFIRYQGGGGSPVLVDIWFTGSASAPTSNKNCVIQNNKFGSEGFNAADVRILLADEDAGTNYIDKNHATTLSTRWNNGLCFQNNHHSNVGGALRGFIYAYKGPEYMSGLIIDEQLCYTYPYIIECDSVVPASGAANISSKNGIIYGRYPGADFFKNKPIPVCNRLHGHVVIDECGMLGSQEAIPTAYPDGASAYYDRVLSAAAELISSWTTASVTVSPITDARGGTNATTVTAASSTAYLYKDLSLASVDVGLLTWIAVDVKKASTLPVSHMQISIRNSVGSAFWTRRVELTDDWRTVCLPWIPGQNAAALSISVDVVGYSAGVSTNYDVGNPRIYRAQVPVARDTQTLTNFKTWDPDSIANGASATTTLTITGAAIGDFVLPSFSLSLAGLALTAYVSAADTVTAVLSNATGGAVDLASGKLTCKVFRNL